jgi:DNA-binding transcriptional regulator YdaS (Cro superfamily)
METIHDSAALDLVLKQVGSRAELARRMGVKPQAITKWRKQIPVKQVLALEKLTGVSRHRLRPDIYPAERRARAGRA